MAENSGAVADVWAERMRAALVGTSALSIVGTRVLRHLFTLMVPTTVLSIPVGLLAAALLPIAAAGRLLVVNGRIELVGDADVPLFAWLGVLVLIGVPAAAVAGGATMLMAAGRVLGWPVPWRSALRVAVRRGRGLTALAFVQVAFLALTAAAGVALTVFVNPWAGIAAIVVVGLALMPGLLAMPAMLLEELGPFAALRRAYRLVATMRFTSPLLLAIGVIILHGLAAGGFDWVADRLPYPVNVAVNSAAAVLLSAFQAAVLAVVFLNRIAKQWHEVGRPELRAIVDRLPERDGARTRTAPILALLVLPGLVTGVVAAVNPLGWVEVSDHVAALSPADEADEADDDGGDRGPVVWSRDLTALYVSPGPKLAMYMQGFDDDAPRMLTCPDLTCADLDIFYAGDNRTDRFAATAALPDGRTVVASWDWDQAERNYRLRLAACDQARCSAPGKPIAWWSKDDGQFLWSRLAVAAHPGGVVLVQADRPDDAKTLTFTSCRDLACADPVRHTPVRLRRDIAGTSDKHALKVAFGPDGRPVAAVRDGDSGAVSLVTCGTADCASATVTTPGPPLTAAGARMRGLSLAVRRDGRPVIAYGDPAAGAIKLLDCQDRACSRAQSATLAGDRHEDPPGLVLSGDRALVATFADAHLVVHSCRGTACRATRIAKAGNVPEQLAMSLTGTGRPVIAWIDANPREDEWSLRVTSPLI
ncbi:hypothetical protein [Nonomuraea sp. NPDC023979]|uniref:hypothetical protein n=1 Tax=Nonomuraea sp. NPDC023979 TaxID=3154796 RepID=UPI0033E31A2F